MNQLKDQHKKISKEIKSDYFFYCTVGRALTTLGAIMNNGQIESTKIISHFGGTNIFFAYCSMVAIVTKIVTNKNGAWGIL